MDLKNIEIEYQDTPEKFHEAADGIIAYLAQNLLELNAIEEECSQLSEYQKRGIRIKGMPKDSEGLWALYKARYGKALSAFCTEKLIARGYAQSMNGPHQVFDKNGTLLEEKIYGQYSYLNDDCKLTITMKSLKRAVIEIRYDRDRSSLNSWHQFTLTYTDRWLLEDIKYKYHENDKWRKDII